MIPYGNCWGFLGGSIEDVWLCRGDADGSPAFGCDVSVNNR